MFLGKPVKKSKGGLCKIEVYDIENGFVSFPDVQLGVILGSIQLQPPNEWQEIIFERWTSKMDEVRSESNGAPIYRFTLTGTAHIDSADRFHPLHQAQNKSYVLRVTDLNGKVKIIGSPDDPVSIIVTTRSSGARFADGNKMSIQIIATNRTPFPEAP